MTSRMFPTPVTNISSRSKPRPKPACGTLPYLRVVVDRRRAAEVLLRQIALVLRLEGEAILHGKLEALARRPQQLHRLGVGDALEGAVADELEPLDQPLVHESVAEVQILGARLQRIGHEIPHHLLGQRHVAVEVAEGDLGLDHPELRRVARGMGILRPEGGAEGVDVRQGAGEGFALELAAHGEVGRLAEKLLLPGADGLPVHRHNPEHLARALAVRCRDDRGVDVEEAPLLEEAVDGVGHAATDAEDGAEEIRPGPEMRDRAHELHAVPLLLERVVLRRGPEQGRPRRPHLPALALAGRLHDLALDLDGGTGAGSRHQLRIPRQARIDDHLEIGEAAPVVDLEERKRLRVAFRPDPALDHDGAGRNIAPQERGERSA